jgi:hypothetical protein
VHPIAIFISVSVCSGFVQAGGIAYVLYLLSTSVDAYFANKELPTQYTARNIAVLIQTVIRGLSYLVTFIFAANATGLAALGVQLIIDPDSVQDSGGRLRKPEESIPKVKATDDIVAIRRAFQQAEQMGKRAASRELKKSRSDSDT